MAHKSTKKNTTTPEISTVFDILMAKTQDFHDKHIARVKSYAAHVFDEAVQLKDFVIEDDKGEEFYIEVKGALRGNDPAKFEAFPNDKNLVLLSYKELHDDLKIDVKDPTQNTVKDPTKWPYTILSKIPDWNTKGILTEELKEKVSPNKLYLSIKISV